MTGLELDLRSYTATAATHDHPYHQVILALSGRLDIEIGGRGGQVNAAQGAQAPAGEAHAFASTGRNRFVILNIPTTADAAAARLGGRDRRYFPVTQAVEHLLAYIGSRPDSLSRYAGQMAPLLVATLGDDSASNDNRLPMKVAMAMAFIRGAYRRPIEVQDIALAADISPRRLHDLFRSYAGTTPSCYLSEVRLNRARDLLGGSEQPIAGVALEIGFSDQSAFSRAFRRQFGETPQAYRDRHLVPRRRLQ